MDLFDMTSSALSDLSSRRAQLDAIHPTDSSLSFPPFSLLPSTSTSSQSEGSPSRKPPLTTSYAPYLDDLAAGLKNLRDIPTLVLGVQSDILFNVEQQRDFAEALKRAGNERVAYYELGGLWG
jgi:homoserine acetyltransferase